MKNVIELRSKLSKLFDALEDNKIDVQVAKNMIATSNALLKSAQLQMEHSKFRGIDKSVDFLKGE